ncbi:D-2-hydroxyacid dehydrogenase [Algibacter sp. TI.3.09]|uniref:D-2-hydroxyacid dehydrogenase n=1 Tax=Algibacter sp. TI.3.09 TaxID=3121298 RepID=UPI00311F73E7
MKIVVLDGYTLNPGDLSWKAVEAFGDLEVHDRTTFDHDTIIKHIGEAEIVLTNKTPLPKAVLEKAPNLEYIGVLATGYNVIDVVAAKDLGIVVSNVPVYGTQAVGQFTMALILELCHHVGDHNKAVKNGDWTKSKDFCFWNSPLIELSGKTLGIIGFGRIGQATAKMAQAFGLNILAYNRSQDLRLESETLKYVELDELLKQSDFVSLHCPLTENTEGLINSDSISKMKDSAFLINTSRGGLIVEEDLKNALNNNKLAGAAVDVVSSEPIKADNPLLNAKNCIITPHIAWASKEARARLMQTTADNIEAFLEEKPTHVVS